MSDTLTFPKAEDSQAPLKKKRSLESIEKQKATRAANRERAALDVKTGLDADELAEMDYARKLAEAEARIKDAAISEDNRRMILQEIKVDVYNTSRRYVELTPSMCDVRNCGFDAAKEAGCAGWSEAPVDQPMSDGKTFGERLIQVRDYHKNTAHTVQMDNDHIITASELHRRQWGVGNSVKGEFLKGAK